MKKCLIIILLFISITTLAKNREFQVVGAHFPPWMYEENGNASGFYIELLQMMVKDMKNTDLFKLHRIGIFHEDWIPTVVVKISGLWLWHKIKG